MQDPFDPDAMTSEARTREVASILATGYLRHRALRARDVGDCCVPAPPGGDLRQPENEVDARANRSVHVPRAAGSDHSPDQAAGQEAR
ncbi:MAG: hypothetical protein K8T90_03275 [Planctomycetes bacterium]|nr:hypothetical protein [Planctomycetota bacterium]